MNENEKQPEPGKSTLNDADPSGVNQERRTYDFDDLSKGDLVVNIVFQGNCYELKRTRSGKLVLHK
ncbi:MAG: hemin uptake protein HemP [Pirellulaceae bacterium]